MTLVTLEASLYVRKANPRDRPVGSRMIVLASISPYCAMYALRPSVLCQREWASEQDGTALPSVVSQLSPPMNILLYRDNDEKRQPHHQVTEPKQRVGRRSVIFVGGAGDAIVSGGSRCEVEQHIARRKGYIVDISVQLNILGPTG